MYRIFKKETQRRKRMGGGERIREKTLIRQETGKNKNMGRKGEIKGEISSVLFIVKILFHRFLW